MNDSEGSTPLAGVVGHIQFTHQVYGMVAAGFNFGKRARGAFPLDSSSAAGRGNQGQHQITPFPQATAPGLSSDAREAAVAGSGPALPRAVPRRRRCPTGFPAGSLPKAAPRRPPLLLQVQVAVHLILAAVRRRRRPRVRLRRRNQPGAHRVSLHISRRLPGVTLIQGTTAESRLPEVAATALCEIRLARVVAVSPSEDSRQTPLALGNHHEMHVIAHQAVAPHAQAVARGVVKEGIQVHLAVAVGKEDHLAPVAALGHVMRAIHGHGSGGSRHARIVEAPFHSSQKTGVIWCWTAPQN